MKKGLLSLMAILGISTAAFAGNGTEANPYTVDEVVAMGNDANVPGVYVQGYIVGFINGMSYTNAVFGLPTADENQTNIILGASSAEDDIKYCLPVQLPSGSVRTNLNLWANPDVLGHEVVLGGDIIKYFGQIGIKNTKSYSWIGTAPELGTGGSGSGNTGGGNEYLVNNMDGFTIDNVTLPDGLNYVWQWDATYGAKASAYYNSTNFATESILISPAITLGADTKAASFSQALNFLNGNNRADYVNVVVREGNGPWATANVTVWPAGSDWGFVDNCQIDLSAYAGKTIQIGFRYTSSSTCAPTWEVKRLSIGGTINENPGENPGTDKPSGDCIAFVADGYNYTGPALTKVVISGTQEEGATMMDHPWVADGVCSLSFTNNNSSVSYVTGSVVRWYKGDEITITPEDGQTINGLVMVSGSTNPVCPSGVCTLTAINGTPWSANGNTEGIWTGTLNEAFTFSNGAQVRWQYLEVYYGDTNSVDEILSADDSEAVYYNLQGVKVANPERGIFIKVVGNKAVKVVK